MNNMDLEDLAHRACEEFSADAVEKYGMSASFVLEQSLSYRPELGGVYLAATIEDDREDECEVVQTDLLFFDPKQDLLTNESRLVTILEMDRAKIRARLLGVYGHYHAIELEGRTLRDIYKDLRAALKFKGCIDEYFNAASRFPGSDPNDPINQGFRLGLDSVWPADTKWIACYVVTGGSEGHYIHVDVIHSDQTRDLAFIGKTFMGATRAHEIAAACASLLGA